MKTGFDLRCNHLICDASNTAGVHNGMRQNRRACRCSRMTENSADGSGQRGTAACDRMADQVAGDLPLREDGKIFQGNGSGRK